MTTMREICSTLRTINAFVKILKGDCTGGYINDCTYHIQAVCKMWSSICCMCSDLNNGRRVVIFDSLDLVLIN